MAELTVDITYATALYEAACESGAEAQVFEDACDMIKIMDDNKDLRTFLGSPAISAADKKKELNAMFEGKIAQKLLNFMCILIDKRRIISFERMIRAYEKIYDHKEGVVDGIIYSVKPLSKDQMDSFVKETSRLINENVELVNEVDESLIGGIKILVDGKMIDASFRTQLNKIAMEIRK